MNTWNQKQRCVGVKVGDISSTPQSEVAVSTLQITQTSFPLQHLLFAVVVSCRLDCLLSASAVFCCLKRSLILDVIVLRCAHLRFFTFISFILQKNFQTSPLNTRPVTAGKVMCDWKTILRRSIRFLILICTFIHRDITSIEQGQFTFIFKEWIHLCVEHIPTSKSSSPARLSWEL